jgi:hypothetical protein
MPGYVLLALPADHFVFDILYEHFSVVFLLRCSECSPFFIAYLDDFTES